MIYRVLYDGVDIHTNSLPDVLINPTVETEMNTAGSCSFTLPPDHFAWGDIEVFKGNVEVYENDELIFFGRVANVDQNWNNERIVECEGALAFFNDSIQRPNSWTSNTLISQFLSDILDAHNAQVPDNRKIYLGNVTIDDMYVTRETNYEKTLDVLTRMCIDTNGGYFSLRKDEDDGKIYLDWLKDLTDIAAQPVEFGLNLLDISKSLHAEDIVTGVLARGAEVNDVKIDLHEVGEIDDPSSPVIHHTNLDPDILWHREGLENFGRVVQVKEFNDCETVDGDNGLLAKATEWLVKKNTDVDTIEVDAAELGYFGESYPIFLLGQKVTVNSTPHGLSNVELPMYKISMNLDSGTKRISIGTPPKRELTQISASNMGGGSGSGSSSGGGSGSGGVQDVRVNGTSVVQDGIARVNVPTDTVTESEMNTAISTAVAGKANQSDLESLATAVSGKASQADLNALSTAVAGKASQADLNALSTEVSGKQDKLTPGAGINIDANNVISATGGGTEVVANPSETATDDLETIKIGNTVYDISGGGGSSTNYGKFKCDILFNTPTSSSGWGNPITICTKSVVEEYDVLVLTFGVTQQETATILVADLLSNQNGKYYYLPTTNANGGNFHISGLRIDSNNNLLFNVDVSGDYLYKVYGLKFENKLINRSDIYSEEERMIGRWVDGKPLYQKVLTIASLPNATTVDYQHNIANVDHIFIAGGIAENGQTGLSGQLNYPGSESQWQWNAIVDKSIIRVWAGRDRTSFNYVKVILNYTKTTDTADSGVLPEDPMFISDPMIYSEEERVVGSWTDGKPLYQKTTILTGTYTGNMNSVDFGLGNKNIEVLAFTQMIGWRSNDTFLPIPFYNPTSPNDGAGYVLNTDRSVTLRLGSITYSKLELTLRYTKTTDSILSGPKKGKIVQRSDIYSEEERLVGRWTDGKPLYQKTFTINTAVTISNSWTDTDISKPSNCDLIIWAEVWRFEHKGPIFVSATVNSSNYVRLQSSINYSLVAGSKVTIQYTKTTDLPFSKQLIEDPQFVMMSDIYSEEEQVVGRWTDGKPLYQKTFKSVTSQQVNDWTVFDNVNTFYDTLVNVIQKATFSNLDQVMANPDQNTTPRFAVRSDHKLYYYSDISISTDITVQYTKTTDAAGTGPTKGNLIYLPALYSEEEREVGVWTDGKPLYQKTWIYSGLIDENNWYNTNISLSNAVPIQGEGHYTDTSFPIAICVTNGNIYLKGTIGTSHNVTAFTLRYTKTTDQPGSGTWTPEGQLAHHYSTSEKIVGTWIDGSTVYERTWSGLSYSASTSWTNFVTVPNGKNLIKANFYGEFGTDLYEIKAQESHIDSATGILEAWFQLGSTRTVKVITLQYTKTSS